MKSFWKKTAAGLLALLIVAGATPVTDLAKMAAITASAEDIEGTTVTSDTTTLAMRNFISKSVTNLRSWIMTGMHVLLKS